MRPICIVGRYGTSTSYYLWQPAVARSVNAAADHSGDAMPLPYLRSLTALERSPRANLQLACYLTFTAGAINAGGFLAVRYYTSHMSGIVSAMADELVVGSFALAVQGLAAVLAFVAGAACSALLVGFGQRARLRSVYALPLLGEAVLLIGFGLAGANLDQHRWSTISLTVMLLCFIMGLQNAMIGAASSYQIRTTHITGMVTDVGVELGKLFYWNARPTQDPALRVRADRARLRALATLIGLFFLGGVTGAYAFQRFGFGATLPLAAGLFVLAVVPIADDIAHWLRRA